MAGITSTDNIIFGRGKIWLAPVDPPGEERDLGDIQGARVTVQETRVTVHAGSGAPRTLADVVTDRTTTIAMDLLDISMENLGLFFASEALDQPALAVTDEVLNLPAVVTDGPFLALPSAAGGAVENLVIRTAAGGGGDQLKAGDPDSDYEPYLQHGRIRVKPKAALAGATWYASYTVTASARLDVSGHRTVTRSLRYIESNPMLVSSSKARSFYVPCAEISPSGDFNLRDNAAQMIRLQARVLDPGDGRPWIMITGSDT